MKLKMLVRSLAFSFLAASALAAHAAGEDTYPDKPIKFVVTFPPGGGTDVLARLIGAELTKSVGQTVVVENKPGASGNIGAEFVAKSPADGYTLLVVNSSYAINPGVFSKLPFNPVSDLRGVVQFASTPSVISAPEGSKLRTFKDVLDGAKGGNGLSYASCGAGTPQHLAGGSIEVMAAVKLVHVAYKGCAPAMTDVVSGQVDLGINTLANTVPMVAGKKIRPLAVTSKQRVLSLPDVPTVAESGFPGFEVSQWGGLVTAAGVPAAITEKFQKDMAAVLGQPDVKQSLLSHGFEAVGNTPAQFAAYIKDEIAKWAKIIAEADIKAE